MSKELNKIGKRLVGNKREEEEKREIRNEKWSGGWLRTNKIILLDPEETLFLSLLQGLFK